MLSLVYPDRDDSKKSAKIHLNLTYLQFIRKLLNAQIDLKGS
jgi:hypothetical protein